MLTFINTDNWLLISLSDVEPKSEPISGISFSIGTPVSLFLDSSPTKPPSMIDWPSLAWITVCIWRLLMMMSLAISLFLTLVNVHQYRITNDMRCYSKWNTYILTFNLLGRIISIRDLSRNQKGDVLTNSDITLLTDSNKQICIAKLERMIDW